MFRTQFILLVAAVALCTSSVLDDQPQQIHISLGENEASMVVTWSTMDKTANPTVEYGIETFSNKTEGWSELFVDGGKLKRQQYIHRVVLKDLKPGTVYWYHCGSDFGWSSMYWFKVPLSGENWSPEFAIFGDMGNENAQSLARLQEETQRQRYDAIIHVGDFAYDMDSHNALVGDEYMRQIESIATYVPYMVCPGNHEEKYNFSNYRARFSMPNSSENMMYSFNMGPVHFIGFSTEAYYFLNYGMKLLINQYEWLERDLIEANKPENREKRPWIVTFGHRPMYCSNDDEKACRELSTLVRVGLPISHFFGLEDLFFKYGVDVELWAHQHSYERLYPIYNYTVLKGSEEKPYVNPKAPVHIVTGSAGCKEGHAQFEKDAPVWSAFRSVDYGYTRLKAHNKTHIYLEQVSDDKDGEVIDSVWIVKDQTKPLFLQSSEE